MFAKARLALATPALANANNGNWQTAQRWARMLTPRFAVTVMQSWQGGDEAALIALHARRSADSVQRWREQNPHRPLILVLTGTDLYRDIANDQSARRALAMADRLVVLNELGMHSMPLPWRNKTRICLQSSTSRQPVARKTSRHLRALMVGHLREEKDPRTYFDAAQLLAKRPDILLDHIGDALDPALGDAARSLAAQVPTYRWLGAQTHGRTRARIAQAHVLVHPSRMEGGAHVVIEALVSGTPVLASRIDGNVGLLGAAYDGYFDTGDAQGLAHMLERLRDDPTMLPKLQYQAALRAPLFAPARERGTLHELLDELLNESTPISSLENLS